MAIKESVNHLLKESKFFAIDVGASVELPEHWEKFSSALSFTTVEPDVEAAKLLTAKYSSIDYKIFPMGLSENGGRKKLNIPHVATGASLLEFNVDNPYLSKDDISPIRQIEIDTITFDELAKQAQLSEINLIKLDTQGTELSILKGLSNEYYERCTGIEVEIGVPGGYVSQPSIEEYNLYLKKFGFELFDIRPSKVYHKGLQQNSSYYFEKIFNVFPGSPTISRKIWEVDAVYLKSPEWYLKKNDLALLRKGILSYCIYNFFIEALYLIEIAQKGNLLSANEAQSLTDIVVQIHKEKEYKSLYSNKPLFKFVRKILQRFRIMPRSTKYWSGYMYQG